MRRPIVEKFHHQGVPLEHVLDDPPLDAGAASMDDADLSEPCRVCFVQVLFDDRRDVSRGERMKIERSFDGNAEWVLILHRYGAGVDLS